MAATDGSLVARRRRRIMTEGYTAHHAGLLLAENPYATASVRRLWRDGWMEREKVTVGEAHLRFIATGRHPE